MINIGFNRPIFFLFHILFLVYICNVNNNKTNNIMTQVEISIRDARQVQDIMQDNGLFNQVNWIASNAFEFDNDNEELLNELELIQQESGLEIFIN